MGKISANLTMQDEEREFYHALGKTITQWQEVEEALALIFMGAIGGQIESAAPANAAYHSVLNFNTKLGMIDSAFVMKEFTSAVEIPYARSFLMTEWIPLHGRCKKRQDRRNEFAHFSREVDQSAKPGRRIFLTPSPINLRAWVHHGGKPPKRTLCEIVASGNSFEKLGLDLKIFFAKHF